MAENITFTERESKIMACAFQSLKTPPEIDWAKMAPLAGFTNVGSARNAMAAIRKKMCAVADAGAGLGVAGSASTPSTPKKSTTPGPNTPRKTPVKRSAAAAGGAGGKKRKANAIDDDDDEEAKGNKVKESPAKKKAAKPEMEEYEDPLGNEEDAFPGFENDGEEDKTI